MRARKIRMSCDACSSSKTKCDQTRPVCNRCQKYLLKCNYSVSQRRGKPPASSRDPSGPVPARRLAKPAEETVNSSRLDSDHAGVEPICHDSDSSMTEISLPMQDEETPGFWQQFTPGMSESSSRELLVTPSKYFDQDFLSIANPSVAQSTPSTSNNDFFNFENDFLVIEPLPTPSPTEFPPPTRPTSTPAPSDVSQPFRRYDCTRLAFAILESLNLNSQPCSASISTGIGIASMDQILITNKSAVENTHQLLSCPCSLSHQSCMMLALIIEKILALYQTLIRPDMPAHRWSPPAASAEVLVRDTPITIGAYKMDAQDEQRMRMQLISNELRKAAALVDRYAQRFCSLGCQEQEETGLYTALTSLLRRRLKKAVDGTVSALNSS